MTLKFELNELPDDMPEALRGLYKEENGRFILNVEGAAPKEKINEFRQNNIRLQRERDELALALKEKGVEAADVIQRARADKEQTEKRLRQLLIEKEFSQTALTRGVRSEALADIALRAEREWSVADDGRFVRVAADGTPIPDDAKLTPGDWIDSLKTTAPHYFAASSGGGAPGSVRNTEPPKRIKYRSDLGSAADKAAFIRQFGQEKYLSLPPSPSQDALGTVRVKKESDLRREQAQVYAQKNGLSL